MTDKDSNGVDNSSKKDDWRETDFLLREGLDLLAAFRAIKSTEARASVIRLLAAIGDAEREAKEDGESA